MKAKAPCPSRVDRFSREPLKAGKRNTKEPSVVVVTVSQDRRRLPSKSRTSCLSKANQTNGLIRSHQQWMSTLFVFLSTCARQQTTSLSRATSMAARPLCVWPSRRTSVNRSSRSSRKRLHEVTYLKRAGPPRAGPRRALTKKTPVGAGVLWSSKSLSVRRIIAHNRTDPGALRESLPFRGETAVSDV